MATSVVQVIRATLRGFSVGVAGFVVALAALVLGALLLACGAACAVALLSGLVATGLWLLNGHAVTGHAAVVSWLAAAGFFAVTPAVTTGLMAVRRQAAMARVRRQAAQLDRIAGLRFVGPR